MKKIIFSFIFILFLFSPKIAFAGENFDTSVRATYEIDKTGNTKVTHFVRIINNKSEVYAPGFKLTLQEVSPENVTASDNTGELKVNTTSIDQTTEIEVFFNDVLAGVDKEREFVIEFTDKSLVTETGEVWEVSLPKIPTDIPFDSYDVELVVPQALGETAYVSPKPKTTTENALNKYFSFDKDNVLGSGINAAFGEFQVYSFDLIYHLENPLNRNSEVEIAIPPDTSYQKMFYKEIWPKPKNVKVDIDGNWIAEIDLKPRERVDVKVSGYVQIFSDPIRYPTETHEYLTKNLEATEFWQTGDANIRLIADKLGTAHDIYNYVVTNFSYNYNRVEPNVDRFGAAKALQNPSNAICMEFTDAFVALARTKGIPAREINGFAYTENPELQPLSLVADVLHSWPEYWDRDNDVWVPVDPTWGNTTGGTDYFSKLDLRHFTFVIHGTSAATPYPPGSYKLGPNPQKDVFVRFDSLPEIHNNEINLVAEVTNKLPFSGVGLKVIIENPGPTAIYDESLTVHFDGELAVNKKIDSIPPYAKFEVPVDVPYGFMASKVPENININFSSKSTTVPTNKNQLIITNLSAIFIIIIAIVSVIIIKIKKVGFIRLKR